MTILGRHVFGEFEVGKFSQSLFNSGRMLTACVILGIAMNSLVDTMSDVVKHAPATSRQIAQAENSFKVKLPSDYCSLLLQSDGFEGFWNDDDYIIFWSVEKIHDYNMGYQADVFVPGLIFFGSDGSGAGYAFDARQSLFSIVKVPFIGMAFEELETVASSFVEFVDVLQHIKSKQ